MAAPFALRELVGLAREARRPAATGRPLHVSGPGAPVLVAALAAGGRPGLVQQGAGEGASVLVRLLAGAPTAADREALRRATRARVPVVAVQTQAWDGRLPYVPAGDVVDAVGASPLPVERIARAIAAAAGDDAVDLAAGLPVLAEPVRAVCIARAAATAAVVAGTPVGGDVHLPVIATAQTRMLGSLRRTRGRDLAGAEPQAVAVAVGPEIGLPVAVGTLARGAVRRLPRRGAAVRAAVAAGVTVGLGILASRFGDRLPGS